MNVSELKGEFPLLANNPDLIYMDNAATTQKPEVVIEAVNRYYRQTNANVHRSVHELAAKATEAFEGARETVRKFLNAESVREIVFTRGTTEALNLLAYSLSNILIEKDDIILCTALEHHSNFVPWQQVVKARGAEMLLLPLQSDATLDLSLLESLDKDGRAKRVKIVAMGHVSNAFGTINSVKVVSEWCRKHDVPLVLDAAQSVPHLVLDVQKLGVDFLCFSGHKVYGTMGSGVLWGREGWLERMPPWQSGGEMISSVRLERSTWNELPYKFEAGTPNVEAAVGLGAALEWLDKIDMQVLIEKERKLMLHALDVLRNIEGVELYGSDNLKMRTGTFSFNLEGIHCHDVAEFLSNKKIAIRSGFHCAMPAMKSLGIHSTGRISLSIYNAVEEMDRVADELGNARNFFG